MIVIDTLKLGCAKGWRKYEGNPIIGIDKVGECFDVSLLKNENGYRMYFSWRTTNSVAACDSTDGLHWTDPVVVLPPNKETGWEDDINRISVIYHQGKYHMWYSGQVCGGSIVNCDNELRIDDAKAFSYIGYAISDDGIHFTTRKDPVLKPTQPWEKQALMCPHVIYDETKNKFRMWYSGGGFFEPDAIGYAESDDGIHWEKCDANPIFSADPKALWERERTTACQVLRHKNWYYMFYIGFEDIDKARICMARSKDGITNWERHPDNPIISPGRAGSWECEAIYKPFTFYEEDKDRWILWYNGRRAFKEQIGVAFHEGEDLGF